MRSLLLLLSVLLFMSSTAIADERPAAKKYSALLADFEQEGGVRLFAKRFLAFAEENIKEPAAADALFWVVDKVRGRRETARAIELLTQHHVESQKMASGCKSLASSRTVGAETLLRLTLEKNNDKQVRAIAGFYLAQLLDREAIIIEQLQADPKLAPRILQYYGKEYGQHLASLTEVGLAKQREEVYARLLATFADAEIEKETIGPLAEKALHSIRHLSVGKVGPEIEGVSISGDVFKLSDYRGKVVMLSFWGHW